MCLKNMQIYKNDKKKNILIYAIRKNAMFDPTLPTGSACQGVLSDEYCTPRVSSANGTALTDRWQRIAPPGSALTKQDKANKTNKTKHDKAKTQNKTDQHLRALGIWLEGLSRHLRDQLDRLFNGKRSFPLGKKCGHFCIEVHDVTVPRLSSTLFSPGILDRTRLDSV